MAENKAKNFLLYNSLTKDEYEHSKSYIHRLNHNILKTLSFLTIFVCVVALVLSFFDFAKGALTSYRILCYIALPISLFCAFFPAKEGGAIYHSEVYIFTLMHISIGMFLALRDFNNISVYICVLVVVAPAMFFGKLIYSWLIESIVYITFVTVRVLTVTNLEILVTDIVDMTIFMALSFIISYYGYKQKFNSSLYIYKNEYLANTDALTGLLNRHMYNERLASNNHLKYDTVTCIYIDANGLHTVNNTQGHEAGDKMLKTIADTISKALGHENTYRTGGDEFVCFSYNSSDEVIRAGIAYVRAKLADKDISVAIGYSTASCRNLNADLLVSEAEKHMYVDKGRHYDDIGEKDRRS